MDLLLLAFAAFMLFSQKQQPEKKQANIFDDITNSGIFGDGAKNLMDSFSKLNGDGDKTSAIMELISNPIVFNMLKNMLFKEKAKPDDKSPPGGGFGTESVHTSNQSAESGENNYANADPTADFENTAETVNAEATAEKTAQSEFGIYSEDAKDFFRPVENIAGTEVSKELYRLYDGWYLKN